LLSTFLPSLHYSARWREVSRGSSTNSQSVRWLRQWSPLRALLSAEVGQRSADTRRPLEASEAVQAISSSLTTIRATGTKMFLPYCLMQLSKAHADLGEFDDAQGCINEALTAIQTNKERWCEAEVNRVAGEVALGSPEPNAAKAETYSQRALVIARQQQAKSCELRGAMSMARLWRSQGKPQQAREPLAPVYGWFTEGFDTRDLKEANALLMELAALSPYSNARAVSVASSSMVAGPQLRGLAHSSHNRRDGTLTPIPRLVSLRLPARSDEWVTLDASAAILLKTCFQAPKGRRASVERHPQFRSFSSHLQNIGGAHSLVEGPVCQSDRYTLGFGQGLRFHRARTRNQNNIVRFASLELPFR
jgi:hypothetical protein